MAAALSPQGRWAYCAAEDGRVFCFDLTHEEGAKLEHSFYAANDPNAPNASGKQRLAKHQILGLAHHPHRGLLASYADDGHLRLWTP